MNNSVNNYLHTEAIHNTDAAEAFLPILFEHIKPNSVVDVGCGLGTWLNVLRKAGVNEVLGIDGNYIDQSKIQISKEEFILHDLSKPFSYEDKKFDLAICLEVVEHLPEDASNTILETLTGLADDILFSAALPNQGGQNHINEQPFSYWVEKFNKKGFVVKDVFRKEIWYNPKIDWWYRQNMFLITKSYEPQVPILDFYHPDRYNQMANEIQQYQKQLGNFYQGNVSFQQALKTLLKSALHFGK